jgi:hypothetical protein
MADPVVADLVILAIDTLQIAVCEKDVANPMLAADNRFLAPVDTNRGNTELRTAPAITGCTGEPADVTISRT